MSEAYSVLVILPITQNGYCQGVYNARRELSNCVSCVEELVEETQEKKRNRKMKSICNKLQKEKPKLAKYEAKEELLVGRNS